MIHIGVKSGQCWSSKGLWLGTRVEDLDEGLGFVITVKDYDKGRQLGTRIRSKD